MSKATKIYEFPQGQDWPNKWVAISEDGMGRCWCFPTRYPPTLSEVREYDLRTPIQRYQDEYANSNARWALNIINCYEGKYEQFCVWRTDQENSSINTTCNCSISDIFNFGCRCGAFKKEQEAEALRLWENA